MATKKEFKPKIERFSNYLGGFWIKIQTSEEIETEIVLFRGINEFLFSDSLIEPSIELFKSEQLKY